jgi:hypothetical protein
MMERWIILAITPSQSIILSLYLRQEIPYQYLQLSHGKLSGEEISSQTGVGQKKRKAVLIKSGLDVKLENAKPTKSHTTTLVNLLHFLTSRSIEIAVIMNNTANTENLKV